MSRLPTTTESPELIRLRQQAQQTEIKERQALLKDFLGNVKKMIKDQSALHLPKTVEEPQRSTIIQPQVFLSYAWEASTPKLTHLQSFLKQLAADLAAAGLTPWLDLQRMTGDLDEQMRAGIQASQYVLLIGTNRYAERTKPDSQTNVRMELDFTLGETKKNPDLLLPLMLEGDYGTTFPSAVRKFLIRDCRSWYSLEQGQWQSQENYIKELTQSEPLGILPCLLGLNRRERPLLKYRQVCAKQYAQLQQALMNALALLQRHQGDTDSKRNPSRPSIQLTPVLQIPFKELEYDKKADKIGSGSYGEVYRGWWQGKYSVAVKELTGMLTREAEKDLYREAGIMAHMVKVSTEPYPTVRLFGLAIEKPNYALVMEYVPYGTLFDLLQLYSETKLPWDLRYQLAADIADGVALLHRQHILHRDLRSHNILLNIIDGRLRAKLSDFGLSTVKSSVRTHSNVTNKTESVGTRAWMAPELHKRGGQSSPASDIYSYGMVLWELLTQAAPFADAHGDTSLISDWVKEGQTEIIPDDCPPKLAELIKKCWAFQPEDRILMDEIQKELATLVEAHPSAETQAIIETLKKTQEERETKWNARWQGKHRDVEAKQQTETDPTRPIPTVLQSSQAFTSTSKSQIGVEQLELQGQLVTSGKQENEKEEIAALRGHALTIPQESKHPGETSYRQGYVHLFASRWMEARPYFEESTQQGYPQAYLRLKQCYSHLGETTKKEIYIKKVAENMEWFKTRASAGDADAQDNLGECYRDGIYGIEKDYKEAVKWFQRSAEQGFSEAQCDLGDCYFRGNGVEKDEKEAVKWYRKAADQGHAEAQCRLGNRYSNGTGIEKDEKEAVKWYRKAAEQGHAAAQDYLGVRYADGTGVEKDEKEAVKWYRKAAEQEYTDAQCRLGNCYSNGIGIEKDDKEADKWYRKAADQGHAATQYWLGNRYSNGIGVEKDEKEAVKWYRKAAEQGYADAQNKLGLCYSNGTGVEKDEKEEVKWYRKAAEQGHAAAQNNLGLCYSYGTGIEKDEKEAVKWCQKAAEQGHVDAQFGLGSCYSNGIGIEEDDKEAVKWYRKAAEQGFAAAQNFLGVFYFNGTGIEKDEKEAVKWYQKAAEQGFSDAQNYLGVCYSNGTGIEKDEKEAVKWCRKAAEQGHAVAQANLGIFYADGLGIEKDEKEAAKWYRKAADQGHADAQCRLGVCYLKGTGVEEDDIEAVKWIQKAADQGHAEAQDSLKFCILGSLIRNLTKKEEIKRQSPSGLQAVAIPPKSVPIPPISTSQSQQTLMPAPKPQANVEQLQLQDQLIAACKQGDEKAATALLKRGAKPNMPNVQGEQPLGAAVWGMCPEVVNILLKEAKGIAPMTWEECEKHNQKFYQEVFIVPKFDPQTFGEWNTLLQKIDLNLFIRAFHLKKADERWHDEDSSSWENLRKYVGRCPAGEKVRGRVDGRVYDASEWGYVSFRTQIKQGIEAASRPKELLNDFDEDWDDERDSEHTPSVEKKPLPIENKLTSTQQSITVLSDFKTSSSASRNPQTLISTPKPLVSSAQLNLQNQLIVACKQGDEKTVTALLKQGAKPDMPTANGEQPLGAAVWGMCLDVVNALLKEAKGIAPMTWEECEKHNLKYYKEVFIIPKFDPQNFAEWNTLLQKMDFNLFVRAFHLKKVDEQHHDGDLDTSSWDNLKKWVKLKHTGGDASVQVTEYVVLGVCSVATEAAYKSFRTQIKLGIQITTSPKPAPESMSQVIPQTLMPAPKPATSREQFKLQDQLIAACKQGDEETVIALLKQGAKPDMPNANGEQPLGAAVWGMCPDAVNALLKEAKGIAPMAWEECEKHNRKYYQEVFIVPKFDPQTYGEWHQLLQKIAPNPLIRANHLHHATIQRFEWDTSSWEKLVKFVESNIEDSNFVYQWIYGDQINNKREHTSRATEKVYVGHRTQIKQEIESAIQPMKRQQPEPASESQTCLLM
jgi:TPR repeat protein/serine/threonine protein kinase